jgi:hypothetical protein
VHQCALGLHAVLCYCRSLLHTQWLWEHNPPKHSQDWIAHEAAAGGSVPILHFLKLQGTSFGADTLLSAASNGHTAACQYLHEQKGCPLTASACTKAASEGHTSTLSYLLQQGCEYDLRAVCTAAAQGGHIRVLENVLRMQEQTVPRSVPPELLTALLNAAGACDQRACAQWLRDECAAEWPDVLKDNSSGPYYRAWPEKMVQWCREQGCTSPTW